MVVDDIGQMVSRQLIGTLVEHLIVADIALDAYLATNQVVDQNLLTRFHFEANHILLTLSYQGIHLLFRHGERVAHLTAGMAVVLEVLYLIAFLFQFLGRIESNICLISIQQLLDILLIDITTLALAVRTLIATKRDTLVELDAQPLE